HMAIDLGRAQQRLGRDTSPIGANTGHMLALDNGHLHAKLRAADRSDIAAGTGADNEKIVLVSHKGLQDSMGYRPRTDFTSGTRPSPMARVLAGSRCTPSRGSAFATVAASKKATPVSSAWRR